MRSTETPFTAFWRLHSIPGPWLVVPGRVEHMAPEDPAPTQLRTHPHHCVSTSPGHGHGWVPTPTIRSANRQLSRPPGPTFVDVVDWDVDDALARSFLAELPADLIGRLRAEGDRADYPAGTTVYRAGDDPRAALVVRGLIRVFLSSPEGRQVTVRYARPGDVLGIAVLVGGPADTSVQTVEPSSVFRISARTLTAAARRDPRVSWAIAEELNRRLYDVLEQTAVNAFGSVRQRIAVHLLDLASDGQRLRGRLEAHVSQQELADAAGSVREVVARALRDLRMAGIVATTAESVVILDPARLHALSGSSNAL
jgi:CRP/FNR family cyclic AMP-dependent transcriptional regulator